jgi:hypothetical protein
MFCSASLECFFRRDYAVLLGYGAVFGLFLSVGPNSIVMSLLPEVAVCICVISGPFRELVAWLATARR